MGPLIVTGTLLKYGKKDAGWFDDIADSKSFFPTRTADNFARIEETAISVFYLFNKRLPGSPQDILDTLCGGLKCFSEANICGGNIPEEFIWAKPEKTKRRCNEFSEWASKNNMLGKVEVLGFIDGDVSLEWINKAGLRVINLLCKGSLHTHLHRITR